MTTSTKESNTCENIFKRGDLIENDAGSVYIVTKSEDYIHTTCIHNSDINVIGTHYRQSKSYVSTVCKQFNGTITLKSGNNE